MLCGYFVIFLNSLDYWNTFLGYGLASFPGSSAPEREIKLVHAETEPGIFSHMRTIKGREGVERP